MPIAYLTANSASGESVDTVSAALTISGSNTYGVLGAGWNAFAEVTASATFNSQSATRAGTLQQAGSGFYTDLDVFYRVAPTTGDAAYTLSGSGFELAIAAAVYTGVDQTTSHGTVYTGSGTEAQSSWSVSVADAVEGDICVAVVVAHDRSATTAAIGAGTGTQRTAVSSSGGGLRLALIEFTAGSSNPSLTGTVAVGTEGFWFAKAYKLNAAAGGVSGTLARTNANDTLSAAGTTTVTGTLARTNANDTLSSSGTTTVTGTLARTNGNDSSAASGTTTVVGSLARTNASDTLSASGDVGAPTGTVNVTNGNDTLSAQGTVPRSGRGYTPRKYAAEIDRKWVFFDDLRDIEELVREAAQEEAKSLKAKPRTKIKVQPGRIAEKAAELAVEAVEERIEEASPSELAAQHALRQMYRFAYQQALKAIQDDEDDALIALLT